MARGKKKGKSKDTETGEEQASTSKTTVSEQSSTSQAEPAPSNVSIASTKDSESESIKMAAEPSQSVTPTPPPPVATLPATEEVEMEFGGLGLGQGKKRRPRRKKEAAKEPAPVTATAGPSRDTPPSPALRAPEQVPSPWGRGTIPQAPVAMEPAPPARFPTPVRAGAPPPFSGAPPAGPSQPLPAYAQPGPQRAQASRSWQKVKAGPENVPRIGDQPAAPSHPSRPGIPSQQQTQLKQYTTPLPSGQPHTSGPPQTSAQVSLYSIPKKIIGKSVPFRQIKVITNYLAMTIQPLKLYRYDISFKPDKPKKMVPKVYNIWKRTYFPKSEMAFDQVKNCICPKELPNISSQVRFQKEVEATDDNGKVMKFEVVAKFTGVVDLGTIIQYMRTGATSLCPPTEAIQCIDIVLRQGTLEGYVKHGRTFFLRPSNPLNLGEGLEMWTGLFQSAIFTSSPYVNIDVAHKGFPIHQPLMNVLMELRLDPSKPLDKQYGRVDAFKHFLKGLRVNASVGGDTSSSAKRQFICNELKDPVNKCMFTMTDAAGKERWISVYDYFTKEKGIRLLYPNLNCVWVGHRTKSIYYPIELLEVSYGQCQSKMLSEKQLSTMVREAAAPPDVRKRKIEEIIKKMNYSGNPIFKQFGLNISTDFVNVEAKVLPAPRLDCGERGAIEPRDGAWQSRRFFKPEALIHWGFIAVEVDPRSGCDFDNIINMIMKTGNMCGMSVSPPIIRNFDVKMQDLFRMLNMALSKGADFLIIIVSQRGRDYYHRVKKMAECDVGILTQCIKEQTASRRMNMQTVKNILMKVNSKLMGVNQVLEKSSIPNCVAGGGVMVVGADVTHPSPDQTSVPSIASVTASIDKLLTCYTIQMSIQTPKKEMIVDFEDIMLDLLRSHKQALNTLPHKIFVFRDGVSEGQFAEVMQCELRAVYRAYATIAGPNKIPEVLFLLVQKRHHTRFFTTGPRAMNVEPGTVVDTKIVHASELDFYLVSHQAIKGTARPTRYHAVCNTGNIPHDEIEQLSYYLCHLYSRCMRAVSYPTPTYYAHLACMRARSLTYGDKFDFKQLERRPIRVDLTKIIGFSRMFFV